MTAKSSTYPVLRRVPVRDGTIQVIDPLVISYAALRAGDSSESVRLLEAASSIGFFQLDLRGTTAEQTVLDNLSLMYSLAKQYFDQTLDTKRRDERVQDAGIDRGFKTFYSLQTFEIVREELHQDDFHLPDVFDRARPMLQAFSDDVDGACRTILSSLSAQLGAQDSWEAHHDRSSSSESGLKFASAPTEARVADVEDNQHTDGGSFTVLFGTDTSVQAFLEDSKEWAFMPPCTGCALINVGNDLQRLSGGRLHSPRHRVTQTQDGAGERFSISTSLRPNHNVVAGQVVDST